MLVCKEIQSISFDMQIIIPLSRTFWHNCWKNIRIFGLKVLKVNILQILF